MSARNLNRIIVPYCIFLVFLFRSVFTAPSPVVLTKCGPVQGKLINSEPARQDVYEFTSIPFAEPPIDQLRFKKPVPKLPWYGTLQATKLANACIQITTNKLLRPSYISGVVESEDCLYLNIWVPKETLDSVKRGTLSKQLAVYVFIHGGGFINGNTMQSLYNGTIFSGVNNVIFVSIQYRLGSLGFAYFGKNSDAPGNAGLWDQLEALKWISENIGAFGGNNSEITIGGESAGAVSVSLHLLSPYSRKYFQRAIIESGTALQPWALHTPEDAMTVTNIVLTQIAPGRCSSAPNNRSSMADKLKCLRSTDASAFAKADAVPILMGYGFGSTPVIDGDFIPKDPREAMLCGDFHKVPLLMGANRDEGSLFLLGDPKLLTIFGSAISPQGCSSDKFNHTLEETVVAALNLLAATKLPNPIDQTFVNAVQLQYWPRSRTVRRSRRVLAKVIEMIGDSEFICPTYQWANMSAAFQQQNTPVFAYHFSQRPARTNLPEWMGVIHSQEMAFIFGEPFAVYAEKYGYSYDDKLLSKVMMEYWGNFVKYGDPNVRDKFASCNGNAAVPLARSNSCRLREWPPYVGKDCKNQIVEMNTMTQVFNYSPLLSCAIKDRECLV